MAKAPPEPRLRFEDRTLEGEKTLTLRVTNVQGTYLAMIKWHAPWRRYTFRPAPGTIFDTHCLYEVMVKLGALMQARKAKT